MGQFLQTNGDYNIKTLEGGRITLDTGENVGEVRITGNLIVAGETLTVSAEDLNVKDNIITLNFYDGPLENTPDRVLLQYSGLKVDRGTSPPATFLFDEDIDAWQIAFGDAPGPFDYQNGSALKVRRILADASADNGDLTLSPASTGVLKISGVINYELQISDDNHIPNKKYVDDVLLLNPAFQIRSDDSWIIIADKEAVGLESGSLEYYTANTGFPNTGESLVSIIVDQNLNTQFYSNRVLMQDFRIQNNIITTQDSDEDIFIQTIGTGRLRTNYALRMDEIPSTPSFVENSVMFYSQRPSIGTTGLFFAHGTRDGELISKNKALVFSMLF
jgi:hypothetical protein